VPVYFFVKWKNIMSEFYAARAARLPPKDFVLFLFNHVSGLNINSYEAEVSAPLGKDAQGRTVVNIRGLGQPGPNGDGGYINRAEFAYRRTPLDQIDLPTDGSFFDVIGSRPTFVEIVDELRRRTQLGCTVADFIPTEYRSDQTTGYVLKADPNSLRFEGRVNIGNPRRANIDEFIPADIGELTFEQYDGIFDLNLNRIPINFDVTEYPDQITKLAKGYKIRTNDLVLFSLLQVQADYSGLPLTNDTTPNDLLNVYQAEVTYHGPLRQDADDKHLFASRDRVIELTPSKVYAPRAQGVLKLYYSTDVPASPVLASQNIYALNLLSTPASGSAQAAFWAQCVKGRLLDQNGTAGVISTAFQAAFGITYDPILKQALKVTYNGPARPIDQVPAGKTTCNVCELSVVDSPLDFIYGPGKVYY
jgi:hypothetical protein